MGGCRGVHLQAAVPLLVGPGPTVHTLHSVLQAGAIPRYTLYVVAIATAALDTAACMSILRRERMMHCAGAHLPLPLTLFALCLCAGALTRRSLARVPPSTSPTKQSPWGRG